MITMVKYQLPLITIGSIVLSQTIALADCFSPHMPLGEIPEIMPACIRS